MTITMMDNIIMLEKIINETEGGIMKFCIVKYQGVHLNYHNCKGNTLIINTKL